MTRGIFITGTDTGVGKTYVGCCIARDLRSRGINVGVMKPAETGCRMRKGQLRPSDAIALAKAAGVKDPIDMINPYRFQMPVAPAVAARLEGKRIEVDKILKRYQRLEERHDFLIVEGAGGILVPLTMRKTFLDIAEKLALPVLIVARPNLGTLNHTLLTIEALRYRSLQIAGICINDSKDTHHGIAEKTNPKILEQLSTVPVLANMRYEQHGVDKLVRSILAI